MPFKPQAEADERFAMRAPGCIDHHEHYAEATE